MTAEGHVRLSSLDDIFGISNSSKDSEINDGEVVEIDIKDIHPFKGHPFHVADDEDMKKLTESISEYGVISPVTVRSDPEGGYEMISGHRRMRASELAGKSKIPAIICELDDDEATIFMVDANLQREQLLPSEKAFAYRMKMDALNHQGNK